MIVLRSYEEFDVVLWRKPKKEIVLIMPFPYLETRRSSKSVNTLFLVPEDPKALQKFLRNSGASFSKLSHNLLNLDRQGRESFAVPRPELEKILKRLTEKFSVPFRYGKQGFFVEG